MVRRWALHVTTSTCWHDQKRGTSLVELTFLGLLALKGASRVHFAARCMNIWRPLLETKRTSDLRLQTTHVREGRSLIGQRSSIHHEFALVSALRLTPTLHIAVERIEGLSVGRYSFFLKERPFILLIISVTNVIKHSEFRLL